MTTNNVSTKTELELPHFPVEVWRHIFSFLTFQELQALKPLSAVARCIIESLCRKDYHRRFPSYPVRETLPAITQQQLASHFNYFGVPIPRQSPLLSRIDKLVIGNGPFMVFKEIQLPNGFLQMISVPSNQEMVISIDQHFNGIGRYFTEKEQEKFSVSYSTQTATSVQMVDIAKFKDYYRDYESTDEDRVYPAYQTLLLQSATGLDGETTNTLRKKIFLGINDKDLSNYDFKCSQTMAGFKSKKGLLKIGKILDKGDYRETQVFVDVKDFSLTNDTLWIRNHSDEDTLYKLNLTTGKFELLQLLETQPNCVSLHGNEIILGFDAEVKIMRSVAGEFQAAQTLATAQPLTCTFMKKELLFLGFQDGVIEIYQKNAEGLFEKKQVLAEHIGAISCITEYQNILYVGFLDGAIQRWDLRTWLKKPLFKVLNPPAVENPPAIASTSSLSNLFRSLVARFS